MNTIEIVLPLIREHEGVRLKPYLCPAGYQTIGVGRNLETRGISNEESEFLLMNDVERCLQDLHKFNWWGGLNDEQRAALIDLRFCHGARGFRGYVKMLQALDVGDYEWAADELLDSVFGRRQSNRANKLADMLRSGLSPTDNNRDNPDNSNQAG